MNEELVLLVVDDDQVARLAISRALNQAGLRCRIDEVSDGRTALAAAQRQVYDCILLDYQLPQENGMEVLHRLRTLGLKTPVIILTGHGNQKIAVEMMKAGASDYLRKEVLSANSLGQSLRRVLRVHRAELKAEDARAALRRYTGELETRNRELEEFAGTVAHDLRSALTPVMATAQLLQKRYGAALDEPGLELVENIVRSVQEGVRSIEALLFLARLRHQEPAVELLDMEAIVAAALERVAPLRQQCGTGIRLPPGWPAAWGDSFWVEEVWVNYLDNALRYGGTAAGIELGARLQVNGFARFWVCDNGPGLSAEEQARLFLPITDISSQANRHGLGLAIVQRVVFRLGGQVGLESQAGAGSVFWFTLPAA